MPAVTLSRQNKIIPNLLWAAGLIALYFCLASHPAKAFVGGGFGGAVNAATTAAVAGYGAQAATSAADDDGD